MERATDKNSKRHLIPHSTVGISLQVLPTVPACTCFSGKLCREQHFIETSSHTQNSLSFTFSRILSSVSGTNDTEEHDAWSHWVKPETLYCLTAPADSPVLLLHDVAASVECKPFFATTNVREFNTLTQCNTCRDCGPNCTSILLRCIIW